MTNDSILAQQLVHDRLADLYWQAAWVNNSRLAYAGTSQVLEALRQWHRQPWQQHLGQRVRQWARL
jgi:hypothetical protein